MTEARNLAVSAAKIARENPAESSAISSLGNAENQLGNALSRLLFVSEKYPELKSDKQMSQLMEELSSTENRVAFARQAYNDAITFYNTKRESFPCNLVAGLLGFVPAQMLELQNAEARENVKVSF